MTVAAIMYSTRRAALAEIRETLKFFYGGRDFRGLRGVDRAPRRWHTVPNSGSNRRRSAPMLDTQSSPPAMSGCPRRARRVKRTLFVIRTL